MDSRPGDEMLLLAVAKRDMGAPRMPRWQLALCAIAVLVAVLYGAGGFTHAVTA